MLAELPRPRPVRIEPPGQNEHRDRLDLLLMFAGVLVAMVAAGAPSCPPRRNIAPPKPLVYIAADRLWLALITS